jgi:hypothetical protein
MKTVSECVARVAKMDSTVVIDAVWFNDAKVTVFWSSTEGPIEGNGPVVVDRVTGGWRTPLRRSTLTR